MDCLEEACMIPPAFDMCSLESQLYAAGYVVWCDIYMLWELMFDEEYDTTVDYI